MKRIVYFLILLLLPSVFAIGISPSNYTIDVFSDHTHKINFCVFNSEGRDVSLDFEAPGEFVEEFKFSKNNFTAEGLLDCMYVTFKTSEFKSVNESKVTGGILITDLTDAPVYAAIRGKVFFDLSEISYKKQAFKDLGKFSMMAISIFLIGAILIYFLSRKEEHE